jgi:hypothetical protein
MMTVCTITDRECPGAQFAIRRHLVDELGVGFGRWLASPERGRFLAYTLPCPPGQDPLDNARSVSELVELVVEKYLAGCRDFVVFATPDVESRVTRLLDEIQAIRREATVLVSSGTKFVSQTL